MKLVEAFNYIKKIINNGEKKGYSIDTIKNSIDDFIDIAVDDKSLVNRTDIRILRQLAKKTSDVISGEYSIDTAFVNAMNEVNGIKVKPETKNKVKVKKIEREPETSPVSIDCHRSVERDRCGNIKTDRCGNPITTQLSAHSSSCGSSSSGGFGSCGSSGSWGSHC